MSEAWLHRILFVGTAAVVLGVMLEGAEHVRNFRKEGWKPITEKLGFFILVLGLCAELLIQPFIESAETDFRIRAQEQIAGANARAAEAEKKTKESELELAKLREQRVSRHLDPDQMKEVCAALSEFAGQEVTIVEDPSGVGSDVPHVGQQLAEALSCAKWDLRPPIGESVLSCSNASGVLLWAGSGAPSWWEQGPPDPRKDKRLSAARALAAILNADHLESKVITDEFACVPNSTKLPEQTGLVIDVCPR